MRKKPACTVFAFGLLASSVAFAGANSDFEDGTLHGWTPELPFGGNLHVVSGGHLGYCMAADDCVIMEDDNRLGKREIDSCASCVPLLLHYPFTEERNDE